MTTALLLIAIWALAFWMSATFNGALILGTMITAAAAGMGSRSLNPTGILVAILALMLGVLLYRAGLAWALVPGLGWLLVATIIWQNRPRPRPPTQRA